MNDFAVNDAYEDNEETRALLTRHWKVMEAGNLDSEHWLYHDDAVLDYPQSGETIVGCENIKASSAAGPLRSDFKVKCVIGQDDLWVTEYTLAHDGKLKFAVSIMEFRDAKVAHETLYLSDPMAAPAWRAPWVRKPS